MHNSAIPQQIRDITPPTSRNRASEDLARFRAVTLGALLVWVAPGAFEWQPPGVRRDELVDGVRAPGPWRIRAHRRRRLEQRHRHFPQALDAFRSRKQRVIPAHGVEDQALVSLEHIANLPGVV